MELCDGDDENECEWIDILKTKQMRVKEVKKISKAVEWILDRSREGNDVFNSITSSPYLYENLVLINDALDDINKQDRLEVADPVTMFSYLDKNHDISRNKRLTKAQLKEIFVRTAKKSFSFDKEIQEQMENNRKGNIQRHQVYRKKSERDLTTHYTPPPPGCVHLIEEYKKMLQWEELERVSTRS
jgi:midasin (ATPase involved in ribosome maturation)